MKKFWLIFTQSVTISLGIVFVIQMFHPDLLAPHERVIEVKQAATTQEVNSAGSYRLAAKRAMPSVVNIFTSKELAKSSAPRLNDPILRHFFGDPGDDQPPQKETAWAPASSSVRKA